MTNVNEYEERKRPDRLPGFGEDPYQKEGKKLNFWTLHKTHLIGTAVLFIAGIGMLALAALTIWYPPLSLSIWGTTSLHAVGALSLLIGSLVLGVRLHINEKFGIERFPSTETLNYHNKFTYTPLGEWAKKEANTVIPMNDSPTSTRMKLELLKNAEQEILISGSYCGGKVFDTFLNEINKQLERKDDLKVKIISSTLFLTNKNGANNWRKINELTQKYPRRFNVILTNETQQINGSGQFKWISNHAKFMIVDRKYLITGGCGIEDSWANYDGTQTPDSRDDIPQFTLRAFIAKGWRDRDMLVHEEDDGHKPRNDGIVSTSVIEFYKLFSFWDFHGHTREKLIDHYEDLDSNKKFANIDSIHSHKEALNNAKVKVYCTSPEHNRNFFEKDISHLIKKAKKRIQINNMYIHFSPRVTNALEKALDRGVDVTIITNALHEGCPLSHLAFGHRNRFNYRWLHGWDGRDNLHVYEWNVPKITYHTKCAVIDDTVIIGSSNWGYKGLVSMSDNEHNIMIKSEKLAENVVTQNNVDKSYCIQIAKKDARGLPNLFEAVGALGHYISSPRIG